MRTIPVSITLFCLQMISHSCAKSQTAKYPVLILTRFYSLHSYILGSKTREKKQYCTRTRTYVWKGKHGVQRFTKGREKRTIVYGWPLLSAVATPLSFCFPSPLPTLNPWLGSPGFNKWGPLRSSPGCIPAPIPKQISFSSIFFSKAEQIQRNPASSK